MSASVFVPGATAQTNPVSPINPHCAEIWPRSTFRNRNIAKVTSASNAASVLANLLAADEDIADRLECFDARPDDPVPFTKYVRGGLEQALRICLDEIQLVVEHLQEQHQGESA